MVFVVDSREASKNQDILRELEKSIDNVVVEKLELGDYLIPVKDHPVIIERMTKDEILSERKMQQVSGMVTSNQDMDSLVIFEGRIDEIFYYRRVNPNSVYGKLLAIMDGWHVPILFSENKTQTVMWLKNLHRRRTSEKKEFHFIRPSARKGATFEEQQIWCLSSIRGLGYKTSKTLLENFGNVRSVFNASERQLSSIQGIGKKTARQIVSIASGEKNE